MIGQTISHYKILEKLGEGGMGVVYKAHDTQLDRVVALKFLPHHLTANDAEKARFLQEARAAATLNHQHVCTIYRIDEHDDQQFIEMEYVEGQTLRKKIPIQKLEEVLAYAIQIGEALSEAHTKGIVHRDVKAENIMVNTKNQIKVMDFGLAKLKGSLKLTKTSSTVGTLAYMAPEQIQGSDVDARSDIFSYGIVLFEMLAGKTPFRGEHDAAMMYSIVNEEPESILKYRPELPADFDRIIRRALEKDPEDRYQSIADMISELRREQKKSGRVVRPTEPVQQTSHAAQTIVQPSAELRTSSGGRNKKILFGVGAFVALTCAVIVWLLFPGKQGTIDSLAVLPFVNAANDPNSDYLSDGITESLINGLSQLSNLTVMSRSSVFQFKGKGTDPQQAGKTLGVRAVLTGRVTQRGDDLIISTELVDVSNNSHLWGEQYNRKLTDILVVQNEISREISNALSLKLGRDDEQNLEKKSTENTEAYQFYLKGRYYWNKRTLEDLNTALTYFRQAIDKDPNYALAHLGLAETYCVLPGYGDVQFRETYRLAKAAAQQALKIDPTLGEAYATIGYVEGEGDWDWKSADEHFKKAVTLKPNYATAHHWYGVFLSGMGREKEAERELLRALELDPLSLIVGANVGWMYYLAGRYDDAIAAAQNTLQLAPNFGVAHSVLAVSYQQLRKYDKSIEHHLKAEEDLHEYVWPDLAATYAAAGQKQDALVYIRRMNEQPRLSTTYAGMAMAYAALGDKDKAFSMLDQAYENGDYYITFLKTEPRFDPLRSDPRFKALLKRANLED